MSLRLVVRDAMGLTSAGDEARASPTPSEAADGTALAPLGGVEPEAADVDGARSRSRDCTSTSSVSELLVNGLRFSSMSLNFSKARIISAICSALLVLLALAPLRSDASVPRTMPGMMAKLIFQERSAGEKPCW